MKDNSSLLYLLQISDTGFPTGGFSHSSGLEAALKVGLVKNKESLKKFVYCCLENAGSFFLPFLKEAHQMCWDVKQLCDLDRLIEACTSSHVARRASTRQGLSMLDTSIKVFRDVNIQPISEQLPHKHHPIIFGVLCGMLEIDFSSTLTAFLFNSVRSVIASAVRLDLVGPIEAQGMQLDIQGAVNDVILRNQQRGSEDACLMHPHVDIVQNVHDTMFSKLFYS